MPISVPSTTSVLPPSAADHAALERLQPVGGSHDDVRRYSRARRNVLPRADHVTAVSGAWAHEVVLRSEAELDVVLWCPGARSHPELETAAAVVSARAHRAFRISERTLVRIQPDAQAPALLSVVRLPTWDPPAVLTGDARLVLVADGIEYAGNLGTLVRTADACAADALVLTRATARVTHPKAFAASRGMVLTTPVLTYPSIAAARSGLTEAGFTTYVADPGGAMPYRSAGLGRGRTAVVVGSEGDGVSDEWRRGLPNVAIPMLGRADSLNVAVSAAVLLFEARAALDQP
jgi:tRNA G18 (ribose-2'-O)-methylase SpoU